MNEMSEESLQNTIFHLSSVSQEINGNNTTISTPTSDQVNYFIIALYFLWIIGILINIFGIYCLQKQSNGSFLNQRILLQNLSLTMLLRCVYDTITISFYYYRYEWYEEVYFDIIQINVITIVFISIILIIGDRLSYIFYRARYNRCINTVFLTESLLTIWLISLTTGPFIWALAGERLPQIKIYYYVALHLIVLLTAFVLYTSLVRLIRSGSQGSSQVDLGIGNRYKTDMKLLRLPTFLVTTYLLLNGIPDCIFGFYRIYMASKIKLFLWAASVIVYPLTYIVLDEKTRQRSIKALRVSKCCRQPAVETTSRSTSLAVTFRNSIVRNDSDASRISFRIPSF